MMVKCMSEVGIKTVQEKETKEADHTDSNIIVEEEICEIYNSKSIYKYIERNFSMFTKEEVEDITNDVFVYALEKNDTLKDKRRLRSWVYKIAKSFALSAKKSRESKPVELYGDDFVEMLDKSNFAKSYIADEIKRTEIKEYVYELLEVLPPVCRKIMLLRYKEDRQFKEISSIMEMNCSSVRSIHARCVKLLRALLDEEGINLHDFYE